MTVPNIADVRPTRFVSDQPTALHALSDTAYAITVGCDDQPAAVTLQIWVRPAQARRGVSAYMGARYAGFGHIFKPGVHNDLSVFPVSRDGLGSLRMPKAWSVVLFDQPNCTGRAVYLSESTKDAPMVGQAPARSMLVLDPSDAAQTPCVWFQDGPAPQVAHLVRPGRITAPKGVHIDRVVMPAATRLRTFKDADFADPKGDIADRVLALDLGAGSIVLSKPHALRVQNASDGQDRNADVEGERIYLLTDGNGFGLHLDLEPPRAFLGQMRLTFAQRRLREDRWSHLASTFDGTTRRDFVNGQLVRKTDETQVPAVNAEGWTLEYRTPDVVALEGELAAAGIWEGAFDAARIARDRHVVPAKDAEGLIQYWPLNGTGSDTITDIAGNAGADPATWMPAELPRSILQGGTTHRAVMATHEVYSQKAKAADAKASERINRFQAENAREVAEAAARAKAHAYTAGVYTVTGLKGSGVQELFAATEGELSDYGWGIAWTPGPGVDDTVAFAADRTGDTRYWVALTGFDGAKEGDKVYSILHGVTESSDWDLEQSMIYSSPRPMLGLCFDASGEELHAELYWIDDRAMVYSLGLDSAHKPVGQPKLRAQLPRRPAQAYSMAINERAKELVIANGYDIWRVVMHGVRSDHDICQVVVPHADSPNPIAVCVDEGTGNVFWIDGTYEMVRGCDRDGSNLRDLYSAPSPRPGIALDYVDMAGVAAEAKSGQDTTHKRLYWTALPDTRIEATVVSRPGPFAEVSLEPDDDRDRAFLRDQIEVTGTRTVPFRPDRKAAPLDVLAVVPDWVDGDGTPWGLDWENEMRPVDTPDGVRNESYLVGTITNLASGATHKLPSPGLARFRLSDIWHGLNWPTGRYYVRGDKEITIHTDPNLSPLGDVAPVKLQAQPSTDATQVDDARKLAWVEKARFSPSGKFLLSDWTGSRGYMVWDAETGEKLHLIAPKKGGSLALRQELAFAGHDALFQFYQDGHLELIDLASGTQVASFSLPSATHYNIAMHPDGTRLAVEHSGGICSILDLNTGKVDCVLDRGDTHHRGCEPHWIGGGKQLLCIGYDDGVMIRWDAHSGAKLSENAISVRDPFLRVSAAREVAYFLHSGHQPNANGAYEVPMNRAEAHKVLGFGGNYTRGDIRPVMLECHAGFSAQLHIRPFKAGGGRGGAPSNMEFNLFQVGAEGESTVLLALNSEDHPVLTVTHRNGRTATLTYDAHEVPAGSWSSIAVTISPLGWATISLNGHTEIAQGQLMCPETGLRSAGYLSRSKERADYISKSYGGGDDYPPYAFNGDIDLVRLWNKELTEDEVAAFHAHPNTPIRYDGLNRATQQFSTPGRECHLMTGADDGATPPVALHPFSTDGGLVVRSKVGEAHADLIVAEHHRIDAVIVAAKRKAAAQAAAAQKMRKAHEDHGAALRKAKKLESDATTWATNYLAPAQAKLGAAKAHKQAEVDAANVKADAKTDKARDEAAAKERNAQETHDRKINAAQKRLSEQQAKRDSSGFASDGSALKEHQADGDT